MLRNSIVHSPSSVIRDPTYGKVSIPAPVVHSEWVGLCGTICRRSPSPWSCQRWWLGCICGWLDPAFEQPYNNKLIDWSMKPAESFSVFSSQRRQDVFLNSFWESSFHSRMLLQATLALSLMGSSLKSVCCDFFIFSAVMPRSLALYLTCYGIPSYTHHPL